MLLKMKRALKLCMYMMLLYPPIYYTRVIRICACYKNTTHFRSTTLRSSYTTYTIVLVLIFINIYIHICVCAYSYTVIQRRKKNVIYDDKDELQCLSISMYNSMSFLYTRVLINTRSSFPIFPFLYSAREMRSCWFVFFCLLVFLCRAHNFLLCERTFTLCSMRRALYAARQSPAKKWDFFFCTVFCIYNIYIHIRHVYYKLPACEHIARIRGWGCARSTCLLTAAMCCLDFGIFWNIFILYKYLKCTKKIILRTLNLKNIFGFEQLNIQNKTKKWRFDLNKNIT